MWVNWFIETTGKGEALVVAKAFAKLTPKFPAIVSEKRIEDGDNVKFIKSYKMVRFEANFGFEKLGSEMEALIDIAKKHLKKAKIVTVEYASELEMGDRILARVYAFPHWNEQRKADAQFFIVERSADV